MTKTKGFYPGWTGKTRDGRVCGVYAIDGAEPHPIHGWIDTINGKTPVSRHNNGRVSKSRSPGDFILEPSPPETREVWVNEYEHRPATIHYSKHDADVCAYADRIDPARKAILTFVEDEG